MEDVFYRGVREGSYKAGKKRMNIRLPIMTAEMAMSVFPRDLNAFVAVVGWLTRKEINQLYKNLPQRSVHRLITG